MNELLLDKCSNMNESQMTNARNQNQNATLCIISCLYISGIDKIIIIEKKVMVTCNWFLDKIDCQVP